MNNRERIRNCIQNKPIDRAPLVMYFGPWWETELRWRKECTGDYNIYDGYDEGFRTVPVNAGPSPAFDTGIVRQEGDHIYRLDYFGVLQCSIRGKSGIPHGEEFPVSCFEDWERYKSERLDPEDPRRFSENWEQIADELNHSDAAIQLGEYPFGLFGTVRELVGAENLMYMFYDDPELIAAMMNDLTDFWIALYEKVCRDVKVDVLHIWEDMSGKQGPLISPSMIREFMIPNYRKLRDFADRNGLAGMMVDTDGCCDLLFEPFIDGGVNMILPFEVQAGSDVLEIKKQYPSLCLMGGIDKRKLFGDREEIDRELERITPLLCQSGYFPALDHLFSPEISWDNFRYFTARLSRLIRENPCDPSL